MITEPNRTVRLGITDLSFHHATGAVIQIILEKMGFTVLLSFAPHEENFMKLKSGEIDMIASAWLPSSHGLYKEMAEEKIETKELGLHYEPYALWGVPEYVTDELNSIEDLLKPEVQERMVKVIQGINPGAGITRFSIKMMKEYGLNKAGYTFHFGTQEACFSAFEEAVKEKKWVVVPLWHPQFLHNSYKIRNLKDPKGLLGGKDRAVLLANAKNLEKLFTPQEIMVLDNIKLSNEIVSYLDNQINRENKSAYEAAKTWSRKDLNITKIL